MNAKLCKTIRRAAKHHPRNPVKYAASGTKNRRTGKTNLFTGQLVDCSRAVYQKLKRNFKNGIDLMSGEE